MRPRLPPLAATFPELAIWARRYHQERNMCLLPCNVASSQHALSSPIDPGGLNGKCWIKQKESVFRKASITELTAKYNKILQKNRGERPAYKGQTSVQLPLG